MVSVFLIVWFDVCEHELILIVFFFCVLWPKYYWMLHVWRDTHSNKLMSHQSPNWVQCAALNVVFWCGLLIWAAAGTDSNRVLCRREAEAAPYSGSHLMGRETLCKRLLVRRFWSAQWHENQHTVCICVWLIMQQLLRQKRWKLPDLLWRLRS